MLLAIRGTEEATASSTKKVKKNAKDLFTVCIYQLLFVYIATSSNRKKISTYQLATLCTLTCFASWTILGVWTPECDFLDKGLTTKLNIA